MGAWQGRREEACVELGKRRGMADLISPASAALLGAHKGASTTHPRMGLARMRCRAYG